MGLHSATIKKFFREHFSEPAMVVKPEQEKALVAKLTAQLQMIEAIDLQFQHRNDDDLMMFTLTDSTQYYGNYFHLTLNAEHQLGITCDHNTAMVGDETEILAFAKSCDDRIKRRQAQKNKRKKIKQLQKHRMIAQIKQLAKSEQFDFSLETGEIHLQLSVRLSDTQHLQLTLPYSKFDDALSILPTSIRVAREQFTCGVRVQMKANRYKTLDWIEQSNP